MRTYHIPIESNNPYTNNDQAAELINAAARNEVAAAGGRSEVAKAFNIGPTIIVVELPDNVDIKTLFPDNPATTVTAPAIDSQTEIQNG